MGGKVVVGLPKWCRNSSNVSLKLLWENGILVQLFCAGGKVKVH